MMKARMVAFAVTAAACIVPAAAYAQHGADDGARASAVASKSEVRIVGRVTQKSATAVTVANATRRVTFHRRATPSLAGIRVGTRVEAEGRRIDGRLTLTSIHRED